MKLAARLGLAGPALTARAVKAYARPRPRNGGAPEMASDAMTREPMAAWIGIRNCWRGMSSLSFFTRPRPTRYAASRCTIDASGSATWPGRAAGRTVGAALKRA